VGLILYNIVKKYLKVDEPVVGDFGPGTNPEIYDLIKCIAPNSHIFGIDKDESWLWILHNDAPDMILLKGKFETLPKIKIVFCPATEKKFLNRCIKENKIKSRIFDMIFLHRNMPYWIKFFGGNIKEAVRRIVKLIKKNGYLFLTITAGHSVKDALKLLEQLSMKLVDAVYELETKTYIFVLKKLK